MRANSRREKAAVLLEVREELEQLKVILRLCQDVKAFPTLNAFEHAIRQVTEIAKQNEGWLKSQPSIRARKDGALLGQADGNPN